MKPLASQRLLAASMSCAVLLLTGCKTIIRENIVSSINTGIGATITENPKTELYEVKLGFIRTQFYSIPTGKNVEGSPITNSADLTPEVVSGIRAHSGIKHLFIGMDVSESFAVGKIAVKSDAATAMYIANADSDKKANAASKAVNQAAQQQAQRAIAIEDKAIEAVMAKVFSASGVLDEGQLEKAIKDTAAAKSFDKLKKYSKADFESALRDDFREITPQMATNLGK